MRPIKMLGLAVAAVMALTAFLGASGASASYTALCGGKEPTGSPLTCQEGTKIANKTTVELNAKSSSFQMESSLGTFQCNSSEFASWLEDRETSNPPGAEASGAIIGFSLGLHGGSEGCETKITFCPKVTSVTGWTPFGVHVLYTGASEGGPNGSFTIDRPNVEIVIECLGSKVHCVYGNNVGESWTGQYYNKAQEIRFTKVPWKKSSGSSFCPATFNVSTNYVISNKTPIYVAEK